MNKNPSAIYEIVWRVTPEVITPEGDKLYYK